MVVEVNREFEGARGAMGRGKGRSLKAALLCFPFPTFHVRFCYFLSPASEPHGQCSPRELSLGVPGNNYNQAFKIVV